MLRFSAMLVPWLQHSILRAARQIEGSGAGIYKLEEKVNELFLKRPLQQWEADRIFRGVKLRLLKMEDYFIRLGQGKRAALSLFVRNKYGLNVGLRREAITQMATYVSLVTDYGYPRYRTKFESRWMDVAVMDAQGDVLIYAENKASDVVLEKLCQKLKVNFQEKIPRFENEEEAAQSKVDDSVMKAYHIWRNKPVFFWGCSPTRSQVYRVQYRPSGFGLEAIGILPHAGEFQVQEEIPF